MRFAVCMGINDYGWLGPTASLRGCVADAREWESLLVDHYGFEEVSTLLDMAATPHGLQAALSRIAERAVEGDTVAITYSGHGTRVQDQDGDEPDGYDEAIVLSGEVYTDDQLAGDLRMFGEGINVVVIADSCHSGTVTRSLMGEMFPAKHPPIPRYAELARPPMRCLATSLHHRFGAPREGDKRHVLLAGCAATETSMDAWLDGGYHGALTYHATRLLREGRWRSWRTFGELLLPCVARTSAQTPQLEGRDEDLDGGIFE